MKVAQNWHNATVLSLRDVSPTVREFELAPLHGAVTAYPPGAHLQVQVNLGQGTVESLQTRSYSLVGLPNSRAWRIAVKRMDGGRGGSLAMWQRKVGDQLLISDAQNFFSLDLSAPGYLVIAGGIGITPLVGMVQRLSSLSRSQSLPLTVLYGARSADELVFADELKTAMHGLAPQALQLFTGAEPMDFAAQIAALPAHGQLYTCGPVPMLESVKAAWDAAGRRPADLRFETFGSSGRWPSQPFRLTVARHGVDILVPADTTLLDALEAAGVPTLSDCRRGECGLCAMDVLALQGQIDHRDVFLSPHDKQQSQRICVCVSRAVGSISLDSSWRPDAM